MKIIVVGLNHRSAPVDIRQKLAFDNRESLRALRRLKSSFPDAEFVLLSTCNRVELYCAARIAGGPESEELVDFISQFHEIAPEAFQDFLYIHEGKDAVSHLLTVASSLDSMVIGEAQIISQVKESYRLACMAKATGKILNRLFHCSFTTAKNVHAATAISSGRVSVAGVAVELAMQLFANITCAKVVVVGAGEMGELLLQHLVHVGCKDITVISRSYDRGVGLAARYGIEAGKWEQLDERLAEADIAIASAAAEDYLFRKEAFEKILIGRKKGALLLIDIAVPRNIDPAVNEFEDVYLYCIDDLSSVAEKNRQIREEKISRGMQIVYDNAADFMDWFGARDMGPLIGRMREEFTQISKAELERFFVGARENAECRDVMEPMVGRIVNKLLHCVIKNIDVVAKKHGPAEAARLLDSIVKHAEEISSETNADKEDSES